MTLHALTSPNWTTVGDASAVALFLHGYGSNERDLVALASVVPDGMPWASLRAPIEVTPGGHAWFRITTPGHPDPSAVTEASDSIWAWGDAVLPQTASVVPIGFSQGGLMATELLRTEPARVLAPVVLGGFVQAGE